MKNVKKTLLLALSFVLGATLSLVGTLAYLTSTDEDVNTMTMGNVKISQHEYERTKKADGSYKMTTSATGEGYKLASFKQLKPLYPVTGIPAEEGNVYFDQLGLGATGTVSPLEGKNVQDKFVFVENTGRSDAYVRTIIAYEIGTLDETRFNQIIKRTEGTTSWTQENVGIAEIDGSHYLLVEYVYNTILPAGKYTAENSLGQVYMVSEATNEDCEALDENGNHTYDILVFSQAVQTEGFDDATVALDTAFGDTTVGDETTPANHPWVDREVNIPTVVSTADELTKAFRSAKENIVLERDIELSGYVYVSAAKKMTLNLNGHSITNKRVATGSMLDAGVYVSGKNTELTITGNGTINATYAVWANKGTVNIENGTINGAVHAVYVSGTGKVNISGGTYDSHGYEEGRFTLNQQDGSRATSQIKVTGGKFINFNPADNLAEGEGTNFVEEGYQSKPNSKNEYYKVSKIS